MDALATQTLSWTGSLASTTSTVLTLNTYSGLTIDFVSFSFWVMLMSISFAKEYFIALVIISCTALKRLIACLELSG